MSIIQSIREWIAQECDFLDDFKALFIDFLDSEESYMLEVTPADPIVKRYLNGDTIRRKQFSFCSRVIYGDLANIDTSAFFEEFQEWLEICSKQGNLPTLTKGKQSLNIKALTDGYLYDQSGKMGQYRIQCEFIYFQEG